MVSKDKACLVMVTPKKSSPKSSPKRSPKKSSPKSSPKSKSSSPKKSPLRASAKKSVSFPKSSSPKKSTPKFPIFDQFDHIPLPALQEILLNVDRERLNIICTQSRQAAKVCKTALFQRLYDVRHPGLIVGKIRIIGFHGRTAIELNDEANNTIAVGRQTGGAFANQQDLIFTSADGRHRIRMTYEVHVKANIREKGRVYANFTFEFDGKDVRGAGNPRILKPAKDFLAKVGKLDWWPAFIAIDALPIFPAALSFYKIIRAHVSKARVKWSTFNERAPTADDFGEE